jgi:hypothetical protein
VEQLARTYAPDVIDATTGRPIEPGPSVFELPARPVGVTDGVTRSPRDVRDEPENDESPLG